MIRDNIKQSPDAVRRYREEKRNPPVQVAAGSRMLLVSDGTGDVLAILDITDIRQAEDGALLVRVSRGDDAATLQRRCFDECEIAEWDADKRNTFAEECAHLHEEVSEAFREWRLHKDFEIRYDANGKPTGIPIELADVLIGLFYNAELHGFDLLEAFEIKHRWNLARRYPAEGRQLHPESEASC